MKSDAEVLQSTIDILQADNAWCKGAFFQDDEGNSVPEKEASYASSYCLEGALRVASGLTASIVTGKYDGMEPQNEQFNRLRTRLLKVLKDEKEDLGRQQVWSSIPGYNDSNETTKEDAIRLLKFGISDLEAESTTEV